MIDFVVIGGGIAGVSAAAHLAPHGSVTLLEAESSLAYHTTGRSAALFIVNYGSAASRPLAVASQSFLEKPPEGSTDGPLLSDRGLMWIANEEQLPSINAMAATGETHQTGARLLTPSEVLDLVPVLKPGSIAGGLLEPASDIDVAALHQAFVRIARRNGAEIVTGARVADIAHRQGGWVVTAGDQPIHCRVVVNASGAWGDHVATMAGARHVGLQPMRRTAFMVKGDDSYSEWPMVVDGAERFYFKPDGVQLLCSLSEEVPDIASDARPRMEDVALAIDRINETTTLGIRSVHSQWTGLRTFAPDRDLVIGEDPETPGFFWLVGQGGTGVQTSPGYGALLANLVTGTDLAAPLSDAGVDSSLTDPARFR